MHLIPWHKDCASKLVRYGILVANNIRSAEMKRLISSFLSWIEHADTREMEKYLSQSASISDLERRMREWEKRHQGFNYLP